MRNDRDRNESTEVKEAERSGNFNTLPFVHPLQTLRDPQLQKVCAVNPH